MKKIDLENHFYNQFSVDVLQGREGKGYPYWDAKTNAVWFMEQVSMDHTVLGPKLCDFAEKRIPEMEKLEIEKAVIYYEEDNKICYMTYEIEKISRDYYCKYRWSSP